MKTPLDLRNYIELLATQHKKIKQFYYADYDELIASERSSIDYPLLWMESPDVRPRNLDHYNLEYTFSFLILMAAPVDEKEMQLANSTETYQIANDIISRILKDEEEDDTLNFEIDDVEMYEVGAAAVGNNNETGWRISIKLLTYVDHCYNPNNWNDSEWDFEALLIPSTIGKELGYTKGFFGNCDPDYTEEDSIGDIYIMYNFPESQLYISGSVNSIQIGENIYSIGFYDEEENRTIFEILETPFEFGEEIEIKIKFGIPEMEWDYEGNIVVGLGEGSAYGCFMGDYGYIFPVFPYENEGAKYLFYQDDIIYISEAINYLKINEKIYFFNRSDELEVEENPFPVIDTVMTIKIKQ